ncbi:MAG TPA: phospho-sugar mutase, partial [Opitutales bacterium]|jgi:phosphoglucomutase|nr:phospho-sugar mutase [Opitutales bacterium]
LSFGTGGMRGRVIGRKSAPTELGPGGVDNPAHPAIGANTLNDVTVARATMGLFRSVKVAGLGKNPQPRIVIAHDVRHFSRYFAELCARVWTGLGGEAWLFTGPRSTPQLSFSVRALGADTGIVLTASHNPPHDNGYKAYAAHGGQVVPPLADEIVTAVRAVKPEELAPVLKAAAAATGEGWKTVTPELEAKYADAAAQVVFDPALIRERHPRIVYSALHGTGGVVIPNLLRSLGAEVVEVTAQMKQDGRFPTVPSPNPEDPRALAQLLQQVQTSQAAAGIATDPDDDRLGAIFREADGSYRALTGNELGVLLADYRFTRAKELGWLTSEDSPNSVLLKSFVTTPMLDVVAKAHSARCVNTLTGFKWMGAKLFKYENQLFTALAAAGDKRTRAEIAALSPRERAALSLKYSTWMVFSAEESYGCLAGDAVRDKDANAAAAMTTELAAWLAANGLTATQALDALYARHGYFKESLRTLTFEGAAGVAQIQRALVSMRSDPPKSLGGRVVERVRDFLQEHRDEEGELVPREDFLLYELAGGWRCAIRGSGTEPKLKIYFYAKEPLDTPAGRPALEAALKPKLESWMDAVVGDTRQRAG